MFEYLLFFHILAVICWMAGLFYLPRLFVYHAATTESVVSEQFKIMEYKLYYYITWPAAVVTVGTGIWLAIDFSLKNHDFPAWLITKIAIVGLLITFHYGCGYFLKQFKSDKNSKKHSFYRFFNEIPTILLILILILAVFKPF